MITAKEIQERTILPAATVQKVLYAGYEGDLYLVLEDGVVQVFFHSYVAGTDGRTVEMYFTAGVLSDAVEMRPSQTAEFKSKVHTLLYRPHVYCVFAAFEWEGADLEGLFEGLGDARARVEAGDGDDDDDGLPGRDWWIQISEVSQKVIRESGK